MSILLYIIAFFAIWASNFAIFAIIFKKLFQKIIVFSVHCGIMIDNEIYSAKAARYL